jgi:hypothetical protein
MNEKQIYCTVEDLVKDLNLSGDDDKMNALRYIRSASAMIARKIGNFIPKVETRRFQSPKRGRDLYVSSLLSVTTILNDGVAVTDYDLHPYNRYWPDGPYTRIYTEQVNWDDRDILITGKFGLFDYKEALGLSVTQTDSASTIAVTNGSLLSIGGVLAVEDEQEFVGGYGSTTALTSKLAGAIDAAQATIIIDNGAEVNRGEVIQLSTERMRILAISGNNLVVARGYEGTLKQSHLDDADISVQRTYSVERGVNGTTAAAHDNKTVYQYLAPYDVNWLCREIAGLMYNKAKTGFSGRSGNAETGETFYYNEFPNDPIKKVGENYRIVEL